MAGVARHLVDLTRVGIPGWDLHLACPDGPLVDAVRANGVTVHVIKNWSVPKGVTELRSLLKKLKPDIAHSHLAKADILLALASVGLPVTLVTTEHHVPPDRFMFHSTLPKAVAMETVHNIRLRRFSHAIAVSASTKRDMLKWWKTKTPITVILNGVDRQETHREPGLRFLSLTRLSVEKNVEATLRAFALIMAQEPTAHLTVAGSGPEEQSLKDLAVSLGLNEAVSFPGFVDPEEAMASHDVIMQPSKSDNCSYTLLDAVAARMGVAASPIGGNPEILPSRCIAPFDDDEELARIAIEQAFNLEKRPTLHRGIPSVKDMASMTGEIYRIASRV